MLRPKEFNWHAYWLTTWSTMKPIIYKSKIATICTLQSPNQTRRFKICYVACTHLSSWIGFSRWKVAWRHENKRTPTGTNWTIPFMTLHGRYGDMNFIFMAHDELWRSTGCASGFFFWGEIIFGPLWPLATIKPSEISTRFGERFATSVVFSTTPGPMCWSFLVENLPRIFQRFFQGRLFDLRYPQNCQAWQVSALMQRIDWKRHRVWFVARVSQWVKKSMSYLAVCGLESWTMRHYP